MKLKTLFFVVASSLVFSGCTFMNTYTFPMYEVTPENISILSRGAFPQVNVNDFNAEPKNLADEAIKMRTHSFYSPYGLSFSKYLQEAITLELKLANKFSTDSDTKISGTLLKNNLDADKGVGIIEARFYVTRKGETVYNKVLSANDHWQPIFVGVSALADANKRYSLLVSKLLNKLYSDRTFLSSLKGK